MAVEIGHDRPDHQRLALLDEGLVALQANVKTCRMHQQCRRRSPRLPVHVLHAGFSRDRRRPRRFYRIKIDPQAMFPARIRPAGQFLFVAFAIFSFVPPPGNPFAEGVIIAIRRREIRRRRADFPFHFRVLQSAAGEIIRGHRHAGMLPDKERPFTLSFRGHFKLGPAKLLHLKVVSKAFVVESLHRAFRFKLDLRVSQVHVRRKFE